MTEDLLKEHSKNPDGSILAPQSNRILDDLNSDDSTILHAECDGGNESNALNLGFGKPPQLLLDALNNPENEEIDEITLLTHFEKDPFVIKEAGNRYFREDKVDEAITLWRKALAKYFSASMQAPTIELRNLGISLRGNLAMAFMNKKDWLGALGELEVMLEQDSWNFKGLYRQVTCYIEIGDYEKAFSVVRTVLDSKEIDENDKSAFKLLHNRAVQASIEERELRNKSSKFVFKKTFESEDGGLYNDKEVPRDIKDLSSVVECIKWKDDHIDDLSHEESAFKKYYKADEFTEANDQSRSALPLTILRVLYSLCNESTSIEDSEKRQLIEPELIGNLNTDRLKILREMISRKAYDQVTKKTKRIPFTIHVIGAHGNFEMKAAWTQLLNRMCKVDHMQIVLIGFMSPDDPFGNKLQHRVISPPMANNRDLLPGQQLHMYLFKGSYQEFLYSVQLPKPERLKPDEEAPFPSPNCPLKNTKHMMYPDICVVPHPGFQRDFIEMSKIMDYLLYCNRPIIMTAFTTIPIMRITGSHEMRYLAAIMNHLNAKVVVMPGANPFCMKCAPPGEDDHPLLEFDGYNNSNVPKFKTGYEATGHYGGVAVYWGSTKNGIRDYVPLNNHKAQMMMKELMELNVDVSSEMIW